MEAKQQIIEKLGELVRHSTIRLTNCCNSAILLALHMAKKSGVKTILIQDQGGWLTFKTFPPLLGLEVVEVKTEYGIPDLKDLEAKAGPGSALLINSLAGYIAPISMKEISDICRAKGCLIIEDASGSIGLEGMCDGRLSDIIVGSFGKWKPVNLGYGGFISTGRKELFEIDHELWLAFRFHPHFEKALLAKLERLDSRRDALIAECKKLKDEFAGHEIRLIHGDKPGLNVIAGFGSEAEKEKIINHCKRQGYEFTICPRYIRVMKDAVSIEIKRLEL